MQCAYCNREVHCIAVVLERQHFPAVLIQRALHHAARFSSVSRRGGQGGGGGSVIACCCCCLLVAGGAGGTSTSCMMGWEQTTAASQQSLPMKLHPSLGYLNTTVQHYDMLAFFSLMWLEWNGSYQTRHLAWWHQVVAILSKFAGCLISKLGRILLNGWLTTYPELRCRCVIWNLRHASIMRLRDCKRKAIFSSRSEQQIWFWFWGNESVLDHLI